MRCLSTVPSLQAMVLVRIVPEIDLIALQGLRIRRFSGLQGPEFEFLWLIPVDRLRAFQVGTFIFVGLGRLSVGIARGIGSRRGSSAPQLR